MKVKLRDLARMVNGRLNGDGDLQISGAATIRDASMGDITLVDDARLEGELEQSSATAVVVSFRYKPSRIPSIAVEDVHGSFASIVAHFRPPRQTTPIGISPAAHIADSAKLGSNVSVFPGAVIGEDVEIGDGTIIHGGAQVMAGCRLGNNVTIFPNAVLYENTVAGDRVIIHAGAVIGAYGFGYETTQGRHHLSAQLGYVKLGSDVEVGACSTIDRGTYGATQIGDGTKIDNQVMIAHNCSIGKHNLLCSHVGIAGSCTTGDYVVMAGQVGIGDHLSVGDRTQLGAKAGVMNDIPADSQYVGIPATPMRDQMTKQAAFAKLPEMRKQLKALQKTIDQLTCDADLTTSPK